MPLIEPGRMSELHDDLVARQLLRQRRHVCLGNGTVRETGQKLKEDRAEPIDPLLPGWKEAGKVSPGTGADPDPQIPHPFRVRNLVCHVGVLVAANNGFQRPTIPASLTP